MLIPVSQNKHTIVDDNQFDYLNQWKWYTDHYGYIRTTWRENGVYRKVSMHRLLMEAKEGQHVDHINHDPLDNRKSNLRLCTHSQNMFNKKLHKNNTSGFKGVRWHKKNQRWWARITAQGREYSLGLHDTKEEAAQAYNKAALIHHGKFASLNKVGS